MEEKIMYGLISEDYLMHHGVKGMKWGVRHDPERVGRRHGRGIYESYRTRRYSSNSIRRSNRSINAKKWVKRGAIVAGAILAGAGAAYMIKSGKATALISKGKSVLNIKPKAPVKQQISKTEVPRTEIKKTEVPKTEVKKVEVQKTEVKKTEAKLSESVQKEFSRTKAQKIANKMNPEKDNMNCAFTSLGYTVNRLTGKEVSAVKFDKDLLPGMTGSNGTRPSFYDAIFDGMKRTSLTKNARTFNDLPLMSSACKKIPDNSHGIMFVQNGFGFGHYVNYEKVGGKVHIIDCQSKAFTGKSITNPRDWDSAGIRPLEFMDCTNATIAKDADLYLKKVLKGI